MIIILSVFVGEPLFAKPNGKVFPISEEAARSDVVWAYNLLTLPAKRRLTANPISFATASAFFFSSIRASS